MSARRGLICGGLVAAATAMSLTAAAPDPLTDARARLVSAKAEAAAAAGRATALDRRAATERGAADRFRIEEQAMDARIARAQADVAAAGARVAIVARLLADQRAVLAARQEPAARLIAGLASLARQPAIATVAQPGSITDLVHVRAALGAVLPVVEARTGEVRAALARTRRLEADAALAAQSQRQGRLALVGERHALAALRRAHEASAARLGRGALAQSDRALALGEEARDIVERMETLGSAGSTLSDLVALPGPPTSEAATGQEPAPVYRLPVEGRLVTGLGEISDAGVRSRGLTLAVAPRATIRAPAAGRIVFARVFRGYRGTIIIDHGHGWSTLVTGLGDIAVTRDRAVAAGAPLGHAVDGAEPQVTIELRRRDRAIDIATLLG